MRTLRNILLAVSLLSFCACSEPEDILWNPEWGEIKEPDAKPDQPDTPDNPENPGTNPDDPNQGQQPEPEKVGKARLVWIDAAANFEDYANSKANIAADMARIKETGFTGVIVEVLRL